MNLQRKIIDAPFMQQQQQPTLAVAQPLNDVQLVALIAAHSPHLPAADAVGRAIDVLALAVAEMQAGKLGRRVRELQRAAEAATAGIPN